MKKKKGLRKLGCAGLVLSMMMGLCACGGEKQTTSADTSLAKQYVYSYEEIDLPAEIVDNGSISSVVRQNDRIYMVADIYKWDEETNSSSRELKLLSVKEDGTDLQIIDVETPATESDSMAEDDSAAEGAEEASEEVSEEETAEEKIAGEGEADVAAWNAADVYYPSKNYEYTGYSNYVIGKNSILYAVKDYYFEDYSDPENTVSKQENYICAWDLEGKFLWQKQMENLQTEDSYYYVKSLIPSEDGSMIVLISGDSTYKMEMDAEGNLSEKKELPNGGDLIQQGYDFMVKEDGSILMTHYNDDWTTMYLTTYDLKTDTLGEDIPLPASFAWNGYNCLTTGITTDIVYSNSSGVYGFSAGDEQSTQIMSFINSDLNTTNLNKFIMLDETHFIGFYYDGLDYTNRAAFFTKKNPEDIPDKEVIVVAGNYINYDIKNRIINFNKENEQYRIVVKEYDSYNSMEDYNAGTTQLNNDIISGNMPDILITNSQLPVDSYISKGLIADVGELIEKDEELSQVEFLDNVFNAYSVKDKLYYVVPSFYVRTLAGKTSFLGNRESWTIQEFQDFVASLPEGTAAFGEMTRDNFIYTIMQYGGNDFIDVSTGKCSFDSPEFKGMLEFANSLPKELTEDYYGEDWWMNYQSQYRDNRTVLMEVYISSLRDMNTTLNGYFGEDVSYVGFPTDSGKGSVLYADSSYVLSAKSKNLDGAWQFIRYYLTDEYQKSLDWGFPVVKDIFMEKAQEGTERPYYLDENNEKVEYDNYFTINGEDVLLDPLTQEQVDQLVDVITTTEKQSYYNEDIQNIITEEAEAYFSGQKSVEEVVQIIQSRAQIYVDENR